VQRPRRAPVAAEEILRPIEPEADVIVPMANGEPVGLLDALDARYRSLERLRIHQVHALHRRPSIDGRCDDHLRHVSHLLSPVSSWPSARASDAGAIPAPAGTQEDDQ
jgi:hypothetical protein